MSYNNTFEITFGLRGSIKLLRGAAAAIADSSLEGAVVREARFAKSLGYFRMLATSPAVAF